MYVKKKLVFVRINCRPNSIDYLQNIPCRNVLQLHEKINNSIRKLYLKLRKVWDLRNKDLGSKVFIILALSEFF